MRVWPLLSLCVLAVTACSSPPGPGGRPPGDGPQAMTLQTSPNGEPLGRAVCADALTVWFGRVDANHDGSLSTAEFLNDSDTQFARLDRDHDGFITADELLELRRPFLLQDQPDERRPKGGSGGGFSGGPGGGPPGGGPGGGAPPGGSSGSARGTSGQDVDPVMTADTNLDFKVSPTEFRHRAEEEFAHLDRDGNQVLSQDEVTHSCPAPQPR